MWTQQNVHHLFTKTTHAVCARARLLVAVMVYGIGIATIAFIQMTPVADVDDDDDELLRRH